MCQGLVMTWIPASAEDPSRFPATRVPGVGAPIYVTFVPMTTEGVKFLSAERFSTMPLIKIQTVGVCSRGSRYDREMSNTAAPAPKKVIFSLPPNFYDMTAEEQEVWADAMAEKLQADLGTGDASAE